MSRKLLVNRLSQDELSYELQIRGVSTGMVEHMRHALLENSGDSVKYPAYPFKVEEDVKAVTDKLEELKPLIASFHGSKFSSDFLKF